MPAPAIQKKPAAADLFVCIEGHTSEASGTYVIGDVLLGSHADVRIVRHQP